MDNVDKFLPGLVLNELFYRDVVKQIVEENYPTLAYSAAMTGPGSDVLGFDTERSMDHDWGPRLQLFLSEFDYTGIGSELDASLRRELPAEFQGFAVGFSEPDVNDGGTRMMQRGPSQEINHNITITTVAMYVESALGIKLGEPISTSDWLAFPEQRLLELTSGKVFYDGLGQLNSLREQLSYYPKDVWLYRMAAQWMRLSQEEPFMGRCRELGDELGSRLVAARLVRDMMRLCFLMERRYAPYSKWLGTAFAKLECGKELTGIFLHLVSADSWQKREEYLVAGYEILVDKFNRLNVTPMIEANIKFFFDRPFRVLFAERFSDALLNEITDPCLKTVGCIGAVDQFVDCTDFTTNINLCRRTGCELFG